MKWDSWFGSCLYKTAFTTSFLALILQKKASCEHFSWCCLSKICDSLHDGIIYFMLYQIIPVLVSMTHFEDYSSEVFLLLSKYNESAVNSPNLNVRLLSACSSCFLFISSQLALFCVMLPVCLLE